MTPIAAGGTLLWIVAFALTQLFRDELAESGRDWWAACALSGMVLGFLGTAFMAVMDRRHFSQKGHDGQSSSDPSSS